MAYTPVNLQIFSAAFSGAMAAFGASAYQGSFIQPFSTEAEVALTFAQAVDARWGNAAAATTFEVETCFLASLILMRDRGSFPSTSQLTNVNNWAASAIQIVGCILAGDVRAAAEGITFPAFGGGGGGGAVGVAGAVQFSDGAGNFAADGATFRWDNAAKRLGLGAGAATPQDALDMGGGAVRAQSLKDANGNVWLEGGTAVGGSDNHIQVNASAATPSVNGVGPGANVGIDYVTKGTGAHVIRPGSNSTAAVLIENAAGGDIIRVDSTNGRVGIGNPTGAPAFTLDIGGTGRVTGDLTLGAALDPSIVSLGNFAAGGSIGSAATTVDVAITIKIAQTTAGQTLTVSNPTNTTPGKIVTIQNTGSTNFTMLGQSIAVGQGILIQWNGTAWALTPASSGTNMLDPPVVSLGNFAAGGSIGSAASTVDVAVTIQIAQTTAGQTLTVPNPTNTAPDKLITIQNNGSTSFIMLGEVVPASRGFFIQWNGTAWVATSTTGTALFAQVNLAGPTNRLVTITASNTWTIQPSGANFYQSNAASDFFSINTTSGLITYTGPTRTFMLTAALTFFLAGAVAENVQCVIALNAELVGTTTSSVLAQAVTEAPVSNHTLNPNRVTQLVSGDTIKTLVRNVGSTEDITYSLFTLTAEELSR